MESWNGPGSIATKLNEDSELNEMIAKQSVKDATIYVEPTDGAVRIRGNGITICHLESQKNSLKFMTALQVTLNLSRPSTNLRLENQLCLFLLDC